MRVPCFTLRDETEWMETIKSGWNRLVGTEAKRIVKEVKRVETQGISKKRKEIFGDGRASRRIIQMLVSHFRNEAS
jgi:UDP-N-acetylglucosamine 2-epimerase